VVRRPTSPPAIPREPMLLALALLGCTDPGPLAVSACEAVPGLSTDAAGMALLEPLLIDSSVAILKDATPTRGQEVLGAAGLAQLRAGTTCTADQIDSAGSGRWAVKLTRTGPSVSADGTIGASVTTPLEWQVADTDGGRVEIGLEKANSMRKSAQEAAEKGEHRRAASTLRALSKSFADPVLAVDVAHAEAAQDKAEYDKKLTNAFVAAEDGSVSATFTNSGDRALTDVTVGGDFETPDGPIGADAAIGAVPAGESVDYKLPIPDGAEGSVKLKTRTFTLL